MVDPFSFCWEDGFLKSASAAKWMKWCLLAQLCKSNRDGLRLKAKGDGWDTIGRPHLQGNWERTGSRLVGDKSKASGKQLGCNWETTRWPVEDRQLKASEKNLEATGRQHLENYIWETGNWTIGKPHLEDRWETTLGEAYVEDNGKTHLEDICERTADKLRRPARTLHMRTRENSGDLVKRCFHVMICEGSCDPGRSWRWQLSRD